MVASPNTAKMTALPPPPLAELTTVIVRPALSVRLEKTRMSTAGPPVAV
jgi:hypothetical protein